MNWRDRLASYIAAAPTDVAADRLTGATGVDFSGGRIKADEFNAALTGQKGAKTYAAMRREAMVAATEKASCMPVQAANWFVECEDESIEEQLTEQLFDRLRFKELLRHLCLAWPYGYEVMEKAWTFEDGRNWISCVEHRGHQSITKWHAEGGALAGFEQQAYKDGRVQILKVPETLGADAATHKLIHCAVNQEGNNFEGVSGLRGAYPYHYAKMEIFKIAAIALERFGVGVIEVSPPTDETTGRAQHYTDDQKADAITIAKNLRSGAQSFIWKPSSGWKFDVFGQSSETRVDFLGFLQYCDEMIALNALAEALNLGRTQSGARAVGESQIDLMLLSLEALADTIGESVERYIIDPWLELNVGDARKVDAKLRWSDLTVTAPTMVANLLAKLGPTGFVNPDPDLEDALRELADLPKRPEDMAEELGAASAKAKATHRKRSRVQTAAASPFWREPKPLERFASLSETKGRQDDTRDQIAQVFERWRPLWVDSLEEQLRAAVESERFDEIDDIEIPKELTKKPRAEVVAVMREAFQFGKRSVREELSRQERDAGSPAREARHVARDDALTDQEITDLLATRSTKYIRRLSRAVEETAIELAMSDMRTLGPAAVNEIADIGDDLVGMFSTTANREAAVLAADALNLGRDAEAQAAMARGDIEQAVYSAILDDSVCTECDSADGETVQVGSPEYFELLPPNRRCESTASGNNYCRCIFVYEHVDQANRN